MPESTAEAPDAGDVVWIDFGPPIGREQAGHRPALVVSPRGYNQRSSLMLVCPITRSAAPWPYKVPIPAVGPLTGMILVDQLKLIDPQVRHTRAYGRVPAETLDQVRALLATLIGIPISS